MTSAIVTLFEGDYVLGVGALVNSLYRHGFRGRVYCGHKGPLLFWAKEAREDGAFRVMRPAEGLELRFFPIDHPWHLTNLKPHMMLKVWDEWEPEAEALFYFDPDITIKCRWSFFEEWVGYGVALCEEIVMANMPEDHPLRCAWIQWAENLGWSKCRECRGVLNGGFVGVSLTNQEFLHRWQQGLNSLGGEVSLSSFGPRDRTYPFHMTDQDVLNVLASTFPGALCRSGPEGMDLGAMGFIMSHALTSPKAWRFTVGSAVFRATRIQYAHYGYFNNSQSPIRVLPRHLATIRLTVARILNRLR